MTTPATRGPVAPRRGPRTHGATIEVRTYDVGARRDGPLPNHAFVVVTDNRTGEQRVLRGGPKGRLGPPHVTAEMQPWARSRERDVVPRKQVTTLANDWLPNADAQDLFRQGAALTGAYARAQAGYGPRSNSNSVAQGGYRMMTGKTFDDPQLWGQHTVLPTRPPRRLDPRIPQTLSGRP